MSSLGMQIDTRYHPVVVVRYLTADLTDDDVEYVRSALDTVLQSSAVFVSIVDTTRLRRMPPARISRALEKWVEDKEVELLKKSCGTATIAQSMLARGVARWVLHQRRVKTDGTVVGSFKEAADWAVARLKARGENYEEARLAALLLNEPVQKPVLAIAGEIDEDMRALIEMVMGAFTEPAFLLDAEGELLFKNSDAARHFREVPPWLKGAIGTGHDGLKELCRVVPIVIGSDAFVVVPSAELVPEHRDGETVTLDLPESLFNVARLLAQGFSDKEIAAYTELSTNTVRTYVARIFKRTDVHSRGAFIRTYAEALRGEVAA